MVIGAWVAVFLFLGFPPAWDYVFAVISGLALIVTAYLIKPAIAAADPSSASSATPYVEHKNEAPHN